MQPGDENGARDHAEADPTVIPQQRPPAEQSPYPSYAQPFPGVPWPPAQPVYPNRPVYPQQPVQPQQPTLPPGYQQPGQPVYPQQPGGPGYPQQAPYQPQSYPAAHLWPPTQFPNQQFPPPLPAGPKRRWKVWVAAGVAAFLVLCVLPAVGAVGMIIYSERSGPSASGQQANPSASTSRGPARKPVAGDRWDVYRDWMVDRVSEALVLRDKALVAGEQASYLASGDAAKPQALAVLRRQFATLRELRVGAWRSEVRGFPIKESGEGFDAVWKMDIASHPCFGTDACEESESVRTELWRLVGDKPRVQEIRISTKADKGPRPWEVANLKAVFGARTMVAASPAYAKDLANLSTQAEKAAKVADRLAFGTKPSRYVIFFAGPAEWKDWYSWGPPEWAGGVAIDTGDLRTEIVLNAASLHKSFLDNILRHEFTHASTIPGKSGDSADWWMVEGIAEYAEMDGSPVRLYDSLGLVQKLVNSGSWDGNLDVRAPRDADANSDVGAKYGIGFLAIRQLAERYGEQRMLAFFMAVIHENMSQEAASQKIFGKSWSIVENDLAAYIRAVVR